MTARITLREVRAAMLRDVLAHPSVHVVTRQDILAIPELAAWPRAELETAVRDLAAAGALSDDDGEIHGEAA